MSRHRLVVSGSLTAVALFGLAAWLGGPGRPALHAADDPPAVATTPRPPLAGTASCAGRNCHGGLEPSERSACCRLDEYTTWLTEDAHAGAYRVLRDDRSKEIARRLGIPAAHESDRCLGCHTTPEAVSSPADPSAAALVQQERGAGVGCEACHGAATGWIDAHLTATWRQLDATAKARQGMVDVHDGATLARRCAGCHVGAPPEPGVVGRDVNHDLIAAGHPRLAFEFSVFFDHLPPHWKRKDFPAARRWAEGQFASAEAALELLRYRAATDAAPWPEFAEYDCFSCHHELAGQRWQSAPTRRDGRPRGMPAWGTWYFAIPRALGNGSMPGLDRVAHEMNRLAPRAAVLRSMEAARKELHSQATTAREGKTDAWVDLLLSDRGPVRDPSWDAAEQTYLSLRVLDRVARRPGLDARLNALLRARAFGPGMDAPRSLPAAQGGFDPAAFFAKLRGVEAKK